MDFGFSGEIFFTEGFFVLGLTGDFLISSSDSSSEFPFIWTSSLSSSWISSIALLSLDKSSLSGHLSLMLGSTLMSYSDSDEELFTTSTLVTDFVGVFQTDGFAADFYADFWGVFFGDTFQTLGFLTSSSSSCSPLIGLADTFCLFEDSTGGT